MVKVDWLPPPEDKRNGIIIRYRICVIEYRIENENCNFQFWINSNGSNVHEYAINNLKPDTLYLIRIWAFNNAGQGPAGEIYVSTGK